MITNSLFPRGGGALVLAIALAAPAVLRAQTPAVPKTSGKEYVLAHQSSFDAPPASARNPFWPIGWVPTAAVPTAVAAVALNVKAEDFVVTTISVDAPALAVINGKTRAVGDRIPVSADSQDFVTVKQILDGVVVLDYHGRELRSRNGGGGLPRRAAGK